MRAASTHSVCFWLVVPLHGHRCPKAYRELFSKRQHDVSNFGNLGPHHPHTATFRSVLYAKKKVFRIGTFVLKHFLKW